MNKIICSLIILSFPIFADEFKSNKSKKLAEQLVISINRQLADITDLEIAAGAKHENININLTHHNQFDSGRFGVVMDAKKFGHIISVTPNSPASSLGVQSGDILLRVNNRPISDKDFNLKEQLQYMEDNTNISLLLKRGSREHLLTGTMKGRYIPNWQLNSLRNLPLNNDFTAINLLDISQRDSDLPKKEKSTAIMATNNGACGRVITYTASYLEKGIRVYSPRIEKIDGLVIARGKTRFRLTPGQHILEVVRVQRDNKSNNKFAINVKANMTYSIGTIGGAEWVDDIGNTLVPANYYGPAIVEVREQKCEL
jgi:membrane-associated protease RseP (regulator of RpoE activity)